MSTNGTGRTRGPNPALESAQLQPPTRQRMPAAYEYSRLHRTRFEAKRSFLLRWPQSSRAHPSVRHLAAELSREHPRPSVRHFPPCQQGRNRAFGAPPGQLKTTLQRRPSLPFEPRSPLHGPAFTGMGQLARQSCWDPWRSRAWTGVARGIPGAVGSELPIVVHWVNLSRSRGYFLLAN